MINVDYPWANNGQSSCYDIQNVMTHEIGHFLGLSHNPDNEEYTMYGGMDLGETRKRSLESNDIYWLGQIY